MGQRAVREAFLAALAVGLAIALVFVASRDHSDPETDRWKEEAAAHQADADRWREVAEEAREKIVADSIRSDSIIRAQRERTRQAQRATDEVLASLPDTIQQIVRPIIDAERAEHEAEKREMQEAHERSIQLRVGELEAAHEGEIESLREAIADHERTIERLEERLKPDVNLFGVSLDFGCTVGLSAAAGYGHAAGVGVTCGVAL